MSKANQQAAMTILGVAGVFIVAQWLKSQPNCDRGCQTQLQHLENHFLKAGLMTLFPGLRPFLG